MKKQRFIGVTLIILGILSTILSKNGTAALLIITIGLYALTTEEYILSL